MTSLYIFKNPSAACATIGCVNTYDHGGKLAKLHGDDLQQQRRAVVWHSVARGAWHSGTNDNEEDAWQYVQGGRTWRRLAEAQQQQPSPQHHPVPPPLDYVCLPCTINRFTNDVNVLFWYNVIHTVRILI